MKALVKASCGRTEYPGRWRLFCFLLTCVCVYFVVGIDVTTIPGMPRTLMNALCKPDRQNNSKNLTSSVLSKISNATMTPKSNTKKWKNMEVKSATQTLLVADVRTTTMQMIQKRQSAIIQKKKKRQKKGLETLKVSKHRKITRVNLHGDQIRFMKRMQMKKKDKAVLLDLLKKFLQIADELKLVYMIHGGSLIGSWRHHGMIPWDDDIDVLVNNSQKGALLKKIKSLNPKYTGLDGKPIIKFYSNRSSVKINGVQHRWPFIDICFFEEKGNLIWDNLRSLQGIKLHKDIVFPLHKRPFESFVVDAPRNTPAFLKKFYAWTGVTQCLTSRHNHRTETYGRRMTSLPCKYLKDDFPFVHRKFVNGTMIEVLKVGDKVVHIKLVKEPKYAWTPPYSVAP